MSEEIGLSFMAVCEMGIWKKYEETGSEDTSVFHRTVQFLLKQCDDYAIYYMYGSMKEDEKAMRMKLVKERNDCENGSAVVEEEQLARKILSDGKKV